jgi:hypothetical protein
MSRVIAAFAIVGLLLTACSSSGSSPPSPSADPFVKACADMKGFAQTLADDANGATNVGDLVSQVQQHMSDAADRLESDASDVENYSDYSNVQGIVHDLRDVASAGVFDFMKALKTLRADIATFHDEHCA